MLILDHRKIGEKLYRIRKQYGMTQLEVATAAEISERTYARLERGTLKPRSDTLLRICQALRITPDEIMTDDSPLRSSREADILARLQGCNPKQKETALRILEAYLQSVE